jgi:hypothetical protein
MNWLLSTQGPASCCLCFKHAIYEVSLFTL